MEIVSQKNKRKLGQILIAEQKEVNKVPRAESAVGPRRERERETWQVAPCCPGNKYEPISKSHQDRLLSVFVRVKPRAPQGGVVMRIKCCAATQKHMRQASHESPHGLSLSLS